MSHSDASLRQRLRSQHQSLGAVVLAGGLARRMGGIDKGLVELAQRPMVSWILDQMLPHTDAIVINANRNHARYQALADESISQALKCGVELPEGFAGIQLAADRHAGHLGPLAGLSAGINALNTDLVFMCPCDSPFVSPQLPGHLGHALLDANVDVAVAHDGERLQPVFCVVRRAVLESLNDFLDLGERKIDRWYASQSMLAVPSSEFADSYRNINTDDDRVVAEAELSVSE